MKFLITAIVCLVIGGLFGFYIKPSPNNEYWNKPGFKTDTIKKAAYRMDTGGSKAQVIPPKIVYIYDTTPRKPQNNFKPEIVHDTLRLHDTVTGKTVSLPPCYLNSYITDPRIIAARFTKTAISLDLWDTMCHTVTKVYPTNWEKFDYFWNGHDIKVSDEKMNTIPKTGGFWKQFSSGSSLYITEELLTRTPYLSADYSLNYKKIGLYTMGSIGYNSDLTTRVHIGVRIRLK